MWPTTSGAASRTTSALMGLEPAIEGPPVWMVTVIPCVLAQRTIGAASLPDLTEPSPISPTSLTPAAAISAKSFSTMPSSRMGAPAWTFTPPGRKFAYRSEEHTSELQSRPHLVCRLLLEKKKSELEKSFDLSTLLHEKQPSIGYN